MRNERPCHPTIRATIRAVIPRHKAVGFVGLVRRWWLRRGAGGVGFSPPAVLTPSVRCLSRRNVSSTAPCLAAMRGDALTSATSCRSASPPPTRPPITKGMGTRGGHGYIRVFFLDLLLSQFLSCERNAVEKHIHAMQKRQATSWRAFFLSRFCFCLYRCGYFGICP